MLGILAAAGTGLNIIGKLMAGSSQKALAGVQADAYLNQSEGFKEQSRSFLDQADVAKTNVGLLNTQADIAGLGVDFAGSKLRQVLGQIAESGRQTLAAQRSYFAGNNLDPSFGSPLLAQAITAGRVASDMDIAKASFAVDRANALSNEATLRGQAAGAAGQVVASMGSAAGATRSSINSIYSAMSARMGGDAASRTAVLGAGTSLLAAGGTIMQSGLSMGGGNLSTIQVGAQTFPAFT